MSRTLHRCLGTALALMMLIGGISACASPTAQQTAAPPTDAATQAEQTAAPEPTAEPPITLTLFTYTNYKFEGPVPEAITAKTGVTLDCWDSSNRNDKYPLMLASGDLPDMIVLFQYTDILNNYINAKALLPLNDLIDQYAPNIQKYYGPYLKHAVSEDRMNYFIPVECGKLSDPSSGIIFRQDLLEEIVGQRAIDGDSFTTDEFKTILKTFRDSHPDMKGVPSLPLAVEPGTPGLSFSDSLEGFWGMKTYYEEGDKLSYKWRDPKYIDMLLYANGLVREGYVDVDWPTILYDAWTAKMAQGNVFSSLGAWWDVEAANSVLQEEFGKGTKAQYYMYQLTAPGITKDQVTTDPRIMQGGVAPALTKVNKNPERSIKFLDFLGSPEGHKLVFWGIEGITWDMKDGKMTPRQDVIDEYMADWKPAATKYGVRTWAFMWHLDMQIDDQGTPLDMLFAGSPTVANEFAWKTSAQTKWDCSFYMGLQPSATQPELINYQKVNDITTKAIPMIINAASADEARTLYAQMVKDCDDAGAAQVEAVVNANAAARRDLWGMK